MAVSQTTTVGPDVVVPGSQQLAPAFFAVVTVVAITVAVVSFVRRRRRTAQELPRRRPVVLSIAVVVALVGAGLTAVNLPPPFFVPRFGTLSRLLPAEAFFYRPIQDLPVAADSARWISAMDGLPLAPGISGEVIDGIVWGTPFNMVDRATAMQDVSIKLAPDTSFPGPYPIADPAYIEWMPTYGFDQHYIAVDEDRKLMWELLSTRAWFGRWEADSGARWHLDQLTYGEGSTIATGLPLLPGTVTYDEVAAGQVGPRDPGGRPGDGPGFASSGRPSAPTAGRPIRMRHPRGPGSASAATPTCRNWVRRPV